MRRDKYWITVPCNINHANMTEIVSTWNLINYQLTMAHAHKHTNIWFISDIIVFSISSAAWYLSPTIMHDVISSPKGISWWPGTRKENMSRFVFSIVPADGLTLFMMVSSNGNLSALLVICAGNPPVTAEFSKASDAEPWYFFWSVPE